MSSGYRMGPDYLEYLDVSHEMIKDVERILGQREEQKQRFRQECSDILGFYGLSH